MVSAVVLCLLTTASVCVCGPVAAERKLVYVTVLFRHGDRSSLETFANVTHPESDWPQGYGQLTQKGMKQQFELGQFLRTRYNGFLSETYDRHQIYVRSTDKDRTLMSAAANLAGLYPPSGAQVFHPDLKWQPIPIHTVSQTRERLLLFPVYDCPRYQQLVNETKHTKEFLGYNSEHQAMFDLILNKTGLSLNVTTVWRLHDIFMCETRHNMTVPDWVTPQVMDELQEINNFGLQSLFMAHKHQEKSRMQGGLLLGELVKDLTKAAADSNQKRKMMLLSGHDTTIIALQAALNVYNGKQPPIASSHMFELYREANGSASVSMFYRNDSTVDPYPLQLPGCSLYCPLDDFVRITRPLYSDDWDKECQLPSKEPEKSLGSECSCSSPTA